MERDAAMTVREDAISTLAELRAFVHQTLCEKENLVPEQFRMREMELRRCGQPCGIQFSLFGPRQVRLSAVWAADKNQLYFYDAGGVRFLKLQLRMRFQLTEEVQINAA
jgi:hypothetical protein